MLSNGGEGEAAPRPRTHNINQIQQYNKDHVITIRYMHKEQLLAAESLMRRFK